MNTFGKTNKDILAHKIQQQVLQLILLSGKALKEDAAANQQSVINKECAITYR